MILVLTINSINIYKIQPLPDFTPDIPPWLTFPNIPIVFNSGHAGQDWEYPLLFHFITLIFWKFLNASSFSSFSISLHLSYLSFQKDKYLEVLFISNQVLYASTDCLFMILHHYFNSQYLSTTKECLYMLPSCLLQVK